MDEAYAIVADERDHFGKEALDTLIKCTEDFREDLVVRTDTLILLLYYYYYSHFFCV